MRSSRFSRYGFVVVLFGAGCLGPDGADDGSAKSGKFNVCTGVECQPHWHCDVRAAACVPDVQTLGTHTLVITPSQAMLNACPSLQIIAWGHENEPRVSEFNQPLTVTGAGSDWYGYVMVTARCGTQWYSRYWSAGHAAKDVGFASVRWDNALEWEFADGEAMTCVDPYVANGGVKVAVPMPGATSDYWRCP